MTPTRPYFLRALYQWILDNSFTPYILVDATEEGVQVPQAFVKDGEIILDLSPMAIADLSMENEWVSFNAKFNGVEHIIYIPMHALIGIYAKENGQGMMFPEEESYFDQDSEDAFALDSDIAPAEDNINESQPKKPHLTIVK